MWRRGDRRCVLVVISSVSGGAESPQYSVRVSHTSGTILRVETAQSAEDAFLIARLWEAEEPPSTPISSQPR